MGIQLCTLQWVDSTSKMKLLVLSSIVVAGLCSPDAEADAGYGKRSADADAHYGSYGYRTYGYGYRYPSAYRYYGKRSTDAEAVPEASSYGKRSAEPHGVVGHVHGLGVAGHPGHATSYVGRTIYGYPSLHYGKRSSDADAH